jgi:hypothetical protein
MKRLDVNEGERILLLRYRPFFAPPTGTLSRGCGAARHR